MFKKGDRVLCIRGAEDIIIAGVIYTVLRCHETQKNKVIIKEESKYNWLSSRFILLTPLTEVLV